MNFGKTQLNWFDLLVLALVCVGILRGRKRGISEELLDVFQWLCIVVVGAIGYPPLGRMVAGFTRFPPFYANVLAYAFIAITLKCLFASVKRAAGEKLVQSDAFGRFEYYLGMMAGVTRFMCILIFALSFLHAKYISDSERAATAKMQADNFGSISFPTIGSLQQSIFYESVSGQFIRKNLRAQLVQPAQGGRAGGETMARRR
ncbi:MAG TPA: CvpA family protein, partial [Verrucomicrobiae bacterium]|nr:CvpA family protein [Verrucomicrobiae bacterium]